MFAYLLPKSASGMLGEITGAFVSKESVKTVKKMQEVEKEREVSVKDEVGNEIAKETEKYTVLEEVEVENPVVSEMLEIYFSDEIVNPYWNGEKIVQYERELTVSEIKKEIGDKILQRAFDNNPHAQIADLTSAVLGLSYILVQLAGKEAVQQAVGNLIPSIKSASEVRVAEGLSPYDVSWLE